MRKRNLSEFMCIEMLYDYKAGRLDPLRHQAVEEGLQSSPRVREELKKLMIGISYCDKLKQVAVSEPLVDLVLHQPKQAQKILSKFKWGNFPQPVRWAFEAIVVAVAIALFVTQVPDLFKGKSSEPASMLVKKFDIKPPGPEVVEETEVSNVEKIEPAKVDSEKAESKKTEVAKTEPVKPKPTAPIIASTEIPALLKPIVLEPVKVSTATPTPTQPTESTSAVATVPVEAPKPAKKGNAYVYRMTMYVDDVDTVTPEIVSLITSLGGEKAGEVELGWRRKGGSYFHFSVPQNNSPTLQNGLKKYAQFNMIKSAHPRVMPEGIERYILWVEKKNAGGPVVQHRGQDPVGSDESAEENIGTPNEGAPVKEPAQPQEPTSAD